jgi:hypothetical protein
MALLREKWNSRQAYLRKFVDSLSQLRLGGWRAAIGAFALQLNAAVVGQAHRLA